MNLLIDKRDQEHAVEENDMQDALFAGLNADGKQDEVRAKPFVPPAKRKSSLGFILAAILVLAAAAVIVYYGFYRKGVQLPLSSKQDNGRQQQEEASPETAEQAESIATPSEGTATQNEQFTSCIRTAPVIMAELAKAVNNGAGIQALFFDEGSFSAELKSPDAAALYQSIAGSLGPDIKLTSSQPKAGQNALIAGTFVSRPEKSGVALSNVDLEVLLRDMADEIGAQVMSLTISNVSQGQAVFLRLSGSFDLCRQYLQQLSQQKFSVTVSKLLLMPGQNGNYAFILKFYL